MTKARPLLPSFDGPVNPAMVTLARESRLLTQKELAGPLGVTQGKVSKIEGGVSLVSDAMLRDLASVLGYPPEFFRQTDLVYGVGLGELYHRRQELSAKLLAKVHAQINIRRIHIDRLLRSLDFETRFQPLDLDEYNNNSEEAARAVRSSLLLPRGPVRDLCKTIEHHGGLVVMCDFGTRKVDGIGLWPPKLPPMFFLNEDAPQDRLRLTLCHELGHLLLHQMPNPHMEEEAMTFAAEFLMPADEIRPMLTNLTLPKLADLKLYWRVSMAAILRHAYRLGKITEGQYRYLIVQMSKAGYKMREPAELDVREEQPTLLNELLAAHRGALGFDVPELSAAFAALPDEVEAVYFRSRHRLRVVT